MHSRAYLLIKRDLYLLDNNPIDGIDLEPIVEDNCFDLTFFFRPSKESIWSGCMFRVFCSFNDTFNVQAPSLHFDNNHIPYHPNVDPITGRISLTTNEKWTSRYTLRLLLEELVNAFVTPNQKTIINSDATRMWKYRPNDYRTIIEDSIVKSQELMELINEEKLNLPLQTELIPSKGKDVHRARLRTPPLGARRQHSNLSFNYRVSFEDYLNTWKGIATSKSSLHDDNPLLQQLNTQPKLQAQHLALSANELARQLDDRAIQFERLKYGKLSTDNRSRRQGPPSQISVTDNTYSALVVTEANSRADLAPSYTNVEREENVYDDRDENDDDNVDENHVKNDEVDELIEWTQTLPATTDETVLP